MKIDCSNLLKMFVLACSFIFVYQTSNAQAVGPGDWSRVRQYGHAYNVNDFTTTEYAWIKDHYDLFTIEKRHARYIYGEVSSERASAATAAKLIANNSSIEPLFYWNVKVVYASIYQTITDALAIHPEWANDAGWVWDYPALKTWTIDILNNYGVGAGHAGVFLDQVMAFQGDKQIIFDIMDKTPGIVIYSGYTPRGTSSNPVIAATSEYMKHAGGVYVEFFFNGSHIPYVSQGKALLDSLLNVPNDKIIIANAGEDTENWNAPDHKFSLAAFLIIANDNSYYHYIPTGLLASTYMTYWHSDFDQTLGAPKGKASVNGYVYTRSFANAEVKVDLLNKTSSIIWGKNLALTGIASQSSTDSGGVAARAIDGNTNGVFDGGSATLTENEANAWWQVELESEDSLSLISVFGRSDECCNEGMSDFSVSILNSAGDTTYNQQHTADLYPSVAIDVGGVKGKTIKIRLNEPGSLSLAEVKVFEKIQIIKYDQKFIVRDSENQPISNANVGVNSNYQTTNNFGEVDFSLQQGTYNVTVSKSGYFINSQTCNLNSDSVIYINLEKSIANVEFQIKNGEDIVRYATVKLNDVEKYASSLGITTYYELSVDKEYTYTVEKTGYKNSTSTFTLTKDTTINVQLSTITGVSELDANQFHIYPNPVKDVLNVFNSELSSIKYEVFSISGESVTKGRLNPGENAIDAVGLLPGMYLVKVFGDENTATRKFIKE